MHPQAVPRGFLRFYIMLMVSRAPRTGYDIMQSIEERTEGAWRPGPGTVYPLLKALAEEGFVATTGHGKRESSIRYEITEAGRDAVAHLQGVMAFACKREGLMSRLFGDILTPDQFAPMMVGRTRDFLDVFHEVVREVEPVERERLLREMKVILEVEVDRIDSMLAKSKVARRQAAPAR